MYPPPSNEDGDEGKWLLTIGFSAYAFQVAEGAAVVGGLVYALVDAW
jgi:hypothetical protein